MDRHSKIYVAGHKGLVGSAIWKTLTEKGYDNLVGLTSKELDLTSEEATAKFFAEEKPEYIFLAAAKVGGIMANNTYRADFIYKNLAIQNNVIHQAYVHGVKKLLFLGSTCIYPRDCPQPMKEEYLMTGTLEYTNEPYAIAKIAGIKMCESYNIQYGTNFIAVMPTNLYGPNDNFDLEKSHVLPALIRKIHLGKCLENNDWEAIRADLKKDLIKDKGSERLSENEMTAVLKKHGITYVDNKKSSQKHSVQVEIWGSGKPLREFLWSEEMADACVFIMENVNFSGLIAQKQEIRNTHINIGTGKEISIKELAKLIKKTIGFKGELYFNTEKPDGTMRKLTDPGKLQGLGWKHRIEIEEGIKVLYDWYVSEQNKYSQ